MSPKTNLLQKVSILALSIVVPFLLVLGNSSFPFTGLSLSTILFATLIFLSKQNKSKASVFYITTILFCLCFVIRANSLLTFLNLIAIIYSTCFLIIDPLDFGKNKLIKILAAPLLVLRSIFKVKVEDKYYNEVYKRIDFHKDLTAAKTNLTKKDINWSGILIGSVISILILAIVLPLLSSSNPIFQDFINNTLNFFRLNQFISSLNLLIAKIINAIYTPLNVIRLIMFLILYFNLPKVVELVKNYEIVTNDDSYEKGNLISFSIPKLTTIAVLFAFFIAQIQLYLATSAALASLGYSYGRLNNEVFAQLSIVAVIVIALVYFDKLRKRLNLTTSLILLLQNLFLIYIAFKSDLDYITTWGLTFKRLYGFAVIAWLVGIVIILFVKLLDYRSKYLLKVAAIFTFSIILMVNFINFDNLIYNNLPKEESGQASEYYGQLSTDAASTNDLINKVNSSGLPESTKAVIVERLEFRRANLRRKYSNKNYAWPSFNLSEYNSYKKDSKVE